MVKLIWLELSHGPMSYLYIYIYDIFTLTKNFVDFTFTILNGVDYLWYASCLSWFS